MEQEKTIYQLELHETLVTLGICIMRVPSGWIYDCWDLEKEEFKQGVFVPFDNQFKQEKPFSMDDLKQSKNS